MQRQTLKLWAAAGLSAILLELPFPLAGPMPPWRSVFAWFGLAPLLWAVLHPSVAEGPRPLGRAFLLAYFCGFLWYCGNCYWIRDTMMQYGDMPPMAPTLLLIGFSAVLGLYFGLFGLLVVLVRRASGNAKWALAVAPVIWVALELAAARVTSVPWDQLGYSQVDNGLVNRLAPWTGVYGISFFLVLANSAAAGMILLSARKLLLTVFVSEFAALLIIAVLNGPIKPPPASATAVLIQPNLDVGGDMNWPGAEWDRHIAEFTRLAAETCKGYIAGIPRTSAPRIEPVCQVAAAKPDIVVWPEAPAPFFGAEPKFQEAMAGITRQTQSPLVVGGVGMEPAPDGSWNDFNSAMIIGADGQRVGRYDKIHLVPFGEYVPFEKLLFFARKLTGRVSKFTRGDMRKVFLLPGKDGERHRYGVFICYEAVFADEVREFSALGAEVLVNISDDGWYGDTSAPWQHLNMARMRAIESRRWLLRDTNNGITAVIDPYGTVRQSIPRHQVDALPAHFGFRDDVTFYAAHGDVFAWGCVIASFAIVAWSARRLLVRKTPLAGINQVG